MVGFRKAARQLKIHRNTLTARLRHIERLLGRDLNDLGTLSEPHLALRILDLPPREGPGDPSLDDLLGTPEVRQWAQARLAALADPRLLETLRIWLDAGARLAGTAEALGISAPAVRKRLVRVEGLLARSLLNPPSARYDLMLAFRALGTRVPDQAFVP